MTFHYPSGLQYNWKRPINVTFPKIWRKFEVTAKNGETHKIRIEDLTADRYDEAWIMFEKHFFAEEELHKAANEIADEESMASHKWCFYQYIKQNLSLIAVLDNDELKPTMIGGILSVVTSKDDPPYPTLPGASRANILNFFKIFRDRVDVYEKLNVDCCIKSFGCTVRPEYRQLTIGTELFRTMEVEAKTFNIPASVVIFNNSVSQAIAAKLGFKVLCELKLSDYVDDKGQMILPAKNTKVAQLSYLKFDSSKSK